MDFWWVPVLSIIGGFAFAMVVVVASARTRQHRAELQAQVQAKLIDRFQSAPELIDFLKSSTGQEFVSGVRVKQTAYVTRRLVGSIRAAIFLVVLGIGFLALWPLTSESGFIYPGVLLMALGGAFYFSAIVSVKMARDWGLEQQPTQTEMSSGDGR